MKRCFICYIVIFWKRMYRYLDLLFTTLKLLVLCSMVPSTLFLLTTDFSIVADILLKSEVQL
ncbi:hypothetical protein RhiirA1_28145 [Rhizophagus irregularis]|uniref:Uncharacterized protein n=1 Tax=Rhizophagus irregularis TaxID=588596 RepID=A0A2N0SAD5_9GLOM|nr:hypothetical protein RhiirA1_28145 [Rhizophagus irregularis]